MPNAIQSIPTTNRDPSARWENAMAAFDSARLDYDLYHGTIWNPLSDELDRISPRPDLSFEIEARNGQVARYHVAANRLDEWDDHVSPVFRAKAAAVREAWLDHLDARKRLGYDAATDEVERRCDWMCDRESELIKLPAPDCTALLWKLERLFGPAVRNEGDYCDSWCPDWINAVMDDARSLLSSRDVTMVEPLRIAA